MFCQIRRFRTLKLYRRDGKLSLFCCQLSVGMAVLKYLSLWFNFWGSYYYTKLDLVRNGFKTIG
jgi:hypothetical protein